MVIGLTMTSVRPWQNFGLATYSKYSFFTYSNTTHTRSPTPINQLSHITMASTTSSTSHTSYYKEVIVVMINWRHDDPEGQKNHDDLKSAWEECGFTVKCYDDDYFRSLRRGKWSRKTPFSVFCDLLIEEDEGVGIEDIPANEKLLIVCYIGHGYTRKVDRKRKNSPEHLFGVRSVSVPSASSTPVCRFSGYDW